MSEDYTRRNGFPNPTHFIDDGISGTHFDRPCCTAMMEEVEAGNVEAIIVKDTGCLGGAISKSVRLWKSFVSAASASLPSMTEEIIFAKLI